MYAPFSVGERERSRESLASDDDITRRAWVAASQTHKRDRDELKYGCQGVMGGAWHVWI